MFASDQYELVDFGQGEKLERFGEIHVRRETPAACGKKMSSNDWPSQCLRFCKNSNSESWLQTVTLPEPWLIRYHECCFELKPTPFGHLGVFPEQAANWSWIRDLPGDFTGLKALNLFAYTGGTTMSLAAKGAQVTHVDSAKPVVTWARANAQRSGLEKAAIRWIVEDVKRYVAREIKRGNQYDIVVADPPSFGRGTKNETWKLERDLGELLDSLAVLCRDNCKLVLLSCHTPEYESRRLAQMTEERFDLASAGGEPLDMFLSRPDGQQLPSGSCFRWSVL